MNVLVTGASGFIGSALVSRLTAEDGYAAVGMVRKPDGDVFAPNWVVEDISGLQDPQGMLSGFDAVVHCAARVHVLRDKETDPLAEFRRVNVAGTLNLARQAASAGIGRFVFISSLKVNGESSKAVPFDPFQEPHPSDPYGISKWEAEQGLQKIARETGMEIVIIRPPLVYGPGVKANFRAMMKAIMWQIPLPLGAVHNRRSLVAIDNLLDLIVTCLKHPSAVGQTFMVSDGMDVSTTALVQKIAVAMRRPCWLIPVPQALLRVLLSLFGAGSLADRILGSLQVDISHTCDTLGWTPVVTLDEELASMVNSSNLK